jgi:hypothetical protein
MALVATISVPVSMSFFGSSMTTGRALMSESPFNTSPWRCSTRARSPRAIITTS